MKIEIQIQKDFCPVVRMCTEPKRLHLEMAIKLTHHFTIVVKQREIKRKSGEN